MAVKLKEVNQTLFLNSDAKVIILWVTLTEEDSSHYLKRQKDWHAVLNCLWKKMLLMQKLYK